uniref:PDZ domain-containing protein n=1 Tax=Minutocellus polymorphus TaxID=265543 RepID=A0A7S0ATU5_9STRA|mmetsp:Transcript_3590/g.6243  ORF Transcript_3590/g.6243 Transcript_3590/m.6243 type:complete len:198 (+) Transcript_3590:67-660(+)
MKSIISPSLFAVLLALLGASCSAFSPAVSTTSSSSTTALSMANDNDLLRWARSARTAGIDDRVVELRRPLGVVLGEDADGNVYVETVAARGNAARTGEVREGDFVTMCSSTFGDDMWSCRGAGLSRVLSAIRLRAGPTVKLALESSKEGNVKAQRTAKNLQAEEAARAKAQAKKDSLLEELQKDEQRLKKGKFLGLF